MVISSVCLDSPTLYCVKLFPYDRTWKKPPKLSAISCRASKSTGHENEANYYKLLCLSSSQAGSDEIKRAYRNMALKCHPDVCQDPYMKIESAKRFLLLQHAYETLSDPFKRAEYDYELGLCNSGHAFKVHFDDGCIGRGKWEGQIIELRKRSMTCAAENKGSWGSRIRYKNCRDREMG